MGQFLNGPVKCTQRRPPDCCSSITTTEKEATRQRTNVVDGAGKQQKDKEEKRDQEEDKSQAGRKMRRYEESSICHDPLSLSLSLYVLSHRFRAPRAASLSHNEPNWASQPLPRPSPCPALPCLVCPPVPVIPPSHRIASVIYRPTRSARTTV